MNWSCVYSQVCRPTTSL
uniref:Uncharacterized protein n=1 Tax=Anguilla anguilla TaxID=7936 RepID=A0A0E9QHK7_ANGAN